MKVVAFVPIKLNSRRVHKKNIRKLGDKPLIQYVLETLSSIDLIDEIYVFCSDEAIKPFLVGRAKFLKRDSSLDRDAVKGEQIYGEFISLIEADVYVLAHATSPFVEVNTIHEALASVIGSDFDSAHAVTKKQNFAWYEDRPLNFELAAMPRTQDLAPIYMETSAFFIFKHAVWSKLKRRLGERIYRMVVSDIEGIDIDEEMYFSIASALVGAGTWKKQKVDG